MSFYLFVKVNLNLSQYLVNLDWKPRTRQQSRAETVVQEFEHDQQAIVPSAKCFSRASD